MRSANWLLFGQRLIERGAWYFAPFSWLYALAVHVRNFLYDRRWLPTLRARAVVVSVGNLVAGGTGKTPFVHKLALAFPHRKVAILCRMSDEARLLQRRLPHVQVIQAIKRAEVASTLDADLILLDDGFQHRKLERDLDIVLLHGRKEHYLPWGFLRDSPQRLAQAHHIFTPEELHLYVSKIFDLQGCEIPSIRGWKVGIFCGIARPLRFKKTVESLGAEVIAEVYFADHAPPDLRKLPKVNALICTEKDLVKLPPTDLPIYYLEMELTVKGWEKLIEKIDQTIENRRQS
jgi:tetraacyldisaccharide 4'-kinase